MIKEGPKRKQKHATLRKGSEERESNVREKQLMQGGKLQKQAARKRSTLHVKKMQQFDLTKQRNERHPTCATYFSRARFLSHRHAAAASHLRHGKQFLKMRHEVDEQVDHHSALIQQEVNASYRR